jgi:mannose-6-phosphate isomerase-like protein (cupin superfamily)
MRCMYYSYYGYSYPNQYPYHLNAPINNYGNWPTPLGIEHNRRVYPSQTPMGKDHGPQPFVVNINEATKQNNTYRTVLWTGDHLQVTLMSLGVGEDIGLEMHSNLDQFLRVEQGQGIVQMGKSKNNLNFARRIHDDFAILIPAGTWHNITNTGNIPLKLFSIYAPPQHPHGTVHETKAAAMAAE